MYFFYFFLIMVLCVLRLSARFLINFIRERVLEIGNASITKKKKTKRFFTKNNNNHKRMPRENEELLCALIYRKNWFFLKI